MLLRPKAKLTANTITNEVLDYLLRHGHFAFRVNSMGVPLATGGFRPPAQAGIADILCVAHGGRFVAIEVKAPGDRMRPAQEAFAANVRAAGGVYMVATTVETFAVDFEMLLI